LRDSRRREVVVVVVERPHELGVLVAGDEIVEQSSGGSIERRVGCARLAMPGCCMSDTSTRLEVDRTIAADPEAIFGILARTVAPGRRRPSA